MKKYRLDKKELDELKKDVSLNVKSVYVNNDLYDVYVYPKNNDYVKKYRGAKC